MRTVITVIFGENSHLYGSWKHSNKRLSTHAGTSKGVPMFNIIRLQMIFKKREPLSLILHLNSLESTQQC